MSDHLCIHPLLFFTPLWSPGGCPVDDIGGLAGPLASGWLWWVVGNQNGRVEGICPVGFLSWGAPHVLVWPSAEGHLSC